MFISASTGDKSGLVGIWFVSSDVMEFVCVYIACKEIVAHPLVYGMIIEGRMDYSML